MLPCNTNHPLVIFADKPQCITPTQTIPANVGSLVTMICDVEANPANVTFFWQTKHRDLTEDVHLGSQATSQHVHIQDRAMKSRLEIRIEGGDDFGQYVCLAANFAGVQDEPCYYNVYGEPTYFFAHLREREGRERERAATWTSANSIDSLCKIELNGKLRAQVGKAFDDSPCIFGKSGSQRSKCFPG